MSIEEADLPPEVVAQLVTDDGRGKTLRPRSQKILELAALANGGELNFNQFIIAAWRKYGDVWERKKLRTDLSALAKKGRLVKVRNGVYKAS